MKEVTLEWLNRAKDDLDLIDKIIGEIHFYPLAFHLESFPFHIDHFHLNQNITLNLLPFF